MREYLHEREDERAALEMHGRLGGRLKDDLERMRPGAGRRAEDAVVSGVDDGVLGMEAVNLTTRIERQRSRDGGECGTEKVLGERVAACKCIEALAGVVRVQRDVAVVFFAEDFLFEQRDFGLVRAAPEFAVEILSGARMACAGGKVVRPLQVSAV